MVQKKVIDKKDGKFNNVLLCHDFGFQSVPSRSENELFTRY